MLTCYFGRRGQGKTYAMTKAIMNELNAGVVVYTNYPIKWYGYDQSKVPFYQFLKKIGLKKTYKNYPTTNLRKFHSIKDLPFIEHGSLLALDEGYLYFDSYVGTKMKLGIRKWILFSRHMDIDIWYTAQRASSVQVTMRSMTEIFYKMSAVHFPFLPVLFIQREYDLDNSEGINENECFGTKWFWGSPFFYKKYNTKGDVYMSDSDYQELAKAFDVDYLTLKKHFNG